MAGAKKEDSGNSEAELITVPTGESPLMIARRRRPGSGVFAGVESWLNLPEHPPWLPTFRFTILALFGGLILLLASLGQVMMELLQVVLGVGILLPPLFSCLVLVAVCAIVLLIPELQATPWTIVSLIGFTMLGIWTRSVLLRVEWSQAALALLLDLEEYAEYVGVRKLSPTEEAQKILKGALNKLRALANAEFALAVRQVEGGTSEIVARSPLNFSTTAEHQQELCVRGLSLARTPSSRVSQELPRAVAQQGAAETLWVLPLRRIGYFDGAIVLSWGKRRLPTGFPAVAQFLQRGLRQLLIRYDVSFRLLHVSTRLGEVMDRVSNGIVFVDESREPGLVNPAAAQLLGLSAKERNPERIRAVIRSLRAEADVGAPIYKEAAPPPIPTAGAWTHEMWLYRAPSPRALIVSTAKIEVRQIAGEVWTFEDITDQYFTQEALADANRSLTGARQQAEEANVAKSQFLATVSHELRTPLNGILGMVQLLWELTPASEQREHLSTIRASSNVLLALINNILDFTKLESGRLGLEHRPFELRVCVQEVLDILAPQAAAKGLMLSQTIAADVPARVVGDVMRVQQVLLNLLGNGVKFTERGQVHLELGYAPAEGASPARLRFSIRDTGIGIPADRMDRLFLPFSQLNASMARKFGGAGLGLVICRRLCEAMGGAITIESTLGVGSTFAFTIIAEPAPAETAPRSGAFDPFAPRSSGPFPIVAALPHRAAAAPNLPPAGPPLQLLIVEDNPVNQKVALLMLRRLGHTAEVVDCGQAAIAAVRARRFDAVLMDVEMPDMDGLATTRAIRTLSELPEQPWIIALTANALAGDREMCAAASMDDYLAKPIELARLADALQRSPKARAVPAPSSLPDLAAAPPSSPPAPTPSSASLGPQLDAPLINHDTLEQLRSMLGKSTREGFQALVRKFIADAELLSKELRPAALTANHEALGRTAHTLRGTSATFGAARLAGRCRSLETLARGRSELPELLAAIDALERTLAQTVQALAGTPAATVPGSEPMPAIPVRRDLLANIAHGIRTPLNAILGFSQLLQPLMQDERQRSYLAAILQSGRDLLAVADGFIAESEETLRADVPPEQATHRESPPAAPALTPAPAQTPDRQVTEPNAAAADAPAPYTGTPAERAVLIDALQTLQAQTWPMLCATQNMRLIGQFAEKLRGLAGPEKSPLLRQYAGTLAQQTAAFDIENLALTLEQFPNLVGRIGQAPTAPEVPP